MIEEVNEKQRQLDEMRLEYEDILAKYLSVKKEFKEERRKCEELLMRLNGKNKSLGVLLDTKQKQ